MLLLLPACGTVHPSDPDASRDGTDQDGGLDGAPPADAPAGCARRIAYTALNDVSQSGDVWVTDPGGAAHNLTNAIGDDIDPSWSPDGTQIIFQADRNRTDEIWMIKPDGTEGHSLTCPSLSNCQGSNWGATWSRDGGKIAFLRGSSPKTLWVMTADGTLATQLSTQAMAFGPIVWSPDGRYIAATGLEAQQGDVYVFPVAGGQPRNITNTADRWEEVSDWSADGQLLVLRSERQGVAGDIWWMRSDGSGAEKLTPDAPLQSNAHFGTDGSIFYSSRTAASGPFRIWKMPAGGGQPVKITDHALTQGNDGDFLVAVSADETQLLFTRMDAQGPAGIGIVNLDGQDTGHVVVERAVQPSWSPCIEEGDGSAGSHQSSPPGRPTVRMLSSAP